MCIKATCLLLRKLKHLLVFSKTGSSSYSSLETKILSKHLDWYES